MPKRLFIYIFLGLTVFSTSASAHLFLFVGPSGVGKSTLVRMAIESNTEYRKVASYTSRQPRKGEQDGRDYVFISKEKFLDLLSKKAFFEWSFHLDNFYGLTKNSVHESASKDAVYLKEISPEGATTVKQALKENCTIIYITAPNDKILRERLEQRGSEDTDSLKLRLDENAKMLKSPPQFDVAVTNDSLAETKKLIDKIILQRNK